MRANRQRGMQANYSCWMCKYYSNNCPYMREIYDFIDEAAMNIAEEELINQVHAIITAHWTEENVPREVVRKHISHHIVNQNMIIARSIRDINEMSATVKENVVVVDKYSGQFVVDEKLAKLYLTFINHITNLLKTDNLKVRPERPRPAKMDEA